MGLLKTLSTLVRGKANEANDSFRSKNMDTILDQDVRDQKAELANAKTKLTDLRVQTNLTRKKYEAAKDKADENHKKAVRAAKQNNEELAGKFLEKKKEALAEAEPYKATLASYEKAEKNLSTKIKKLEGIVNDNERQASVLKARKAASGALADANKAIAGMEDGGAFSSFNKFEESVQKLEAEADAYGDLADDDDDLDAQLAADEADDDDELAKLMAKHSKAEA